MTWAPPYVTASDLQSWLGGGDTTELALAAEAASRAIDKHCGRQFGNAMGTRFYVPDRGVVAIDDTFDAGLTVEFDGAPVAYTPLPRNAPANGRPWTQLEVSARGEVAITGEFGWPDVPDAIKLATLILAAQLYERRENVAGRMTSEQVDDVRRGWSAGTSQDLDADVLASIAPYRKLWAAV